MGHLGGRLAASRPTHGHEPIFIHHVFLLHGLFALLRSASDTHWGFAVGAHLGLLEVDRNERLHLFVQQLDVVVLTLLALLGQLHQQR
ncbi:TPA: LOW QUALITY PROTEIN: hypothetical protein N0F65_011053 [Lagenidium giganteum]|uniref:Secreted protein n=1 Tax=Lagenidium giganteum TaxID=4803 RepID=A0AAV2ZLI1_9STRA|nr:TPA: LOW QUALITY PROTEIN: hypothetical protein N0F65_011053 [Lagenidium giganteum]